MIKHTDKTILFDGVCNFCDSSVQFIIKHDKDEQFNFASLQGDMGQKILHDFNIPRDLDSMILVKNEHYYTKTSAVFRICRDLNRPWKIFSILIMIPKPIRDMFYNIFAKHRYKWFGKKKACTLPTPKLRKRFLD